MRIVAEIDRRYRVKILLVAAQRPKYWAFYCMRCTLKVCEVSGDVVAVIDSADMNTVADFHHVPIAVECKRSNCRIVYEFESLSSR